MDAEKLSIVTGAFGFSGKYIARRLLDAGHRVRTLTGHPDRPNPFGDRVEAVPFCFDEPARLVEHLRGADALINTYWVRFPHGDRTFERAIANTKTMIRAAGEAGVRRIVHVSITRPGEGSDLPYFRGKAVLEKAVIESGLSYAIVRPTVIFGLEDILVNNIAWFVRRLPIFGIPGRGDYLLQPVFVEDLADLAVRLASEHENTIVDAVGPDVFTFDECVRLIRDKVGADAHIIHLPARLTHLLSSAMGWLVGDVILTRDEIDGLMRNLLVSDAPPTCPTHMGNWIEANADQVGTTYHSELKRHFR